MAELDKYQRQTRFAHLGRPKPAIGTPVNPTLERSSTLLFDKAEDLYRTDIRAYGRHGNEVQDHLKLAFNHLEGGVDTCLTGSGLSACTLAIMACVKAGDHLLITDNSYGPVRHFCRAFLQGWGVEVEFFDPRIGADISKQVKDNTRLIWMESPGSLTFELHDIPAIVAIANTHNIITAIDNTWSAGLTLRPLTLGVDISVHAATKYFGGHGDVLFGAVTSRTKKLADKVAKTRKYLGHSVSSDDAYQILRGFRTVVSRFEQAETSADQLARFLDERNDILTVFHPALPSHPDHAIWKRDFTGGGCIFSFVPKGKTENDAVAFINALNLFGIGFSYGGYESLAIHCGPQIQRQTYKTDFGGPLIRLACGIENTQDLIDDVTQALAKIS